jgi:hypothetical protein
VQSTVEVHTSIFSNHSYVVCQDRWEENMIEDDLDVEDRDIQQKLLVCIALNAKEMERLYSGGKIE